MSDLQGLPSGYTKKNVVIRFNDDPAGRATGFCNVVLNDPIYNVVYVDWLSVSNITHATASALLGKCVTVKQFRNDGQFSKSSAVDGNDFRFWAYIDSESNQTNQPFMDDMFSPPINLRELNIEVRSTTGGTVNLTNNYLVLQMWCKTSM
jgi:hypothetical protein